MEQMLTVDQAAERVKVSPKTIRQWLRTGKLRGLRAGKFWRVLESDLEAFLVEHTPRPSMQLVEGDGGLAPSPAVTIEVVCAWCVKEGKSEAVATIDHQKVRTDRYGLCPLHRRKLEVALATRVAEVEALQKEVETLRQQVDP